MPDFSSLFYLLHSERRLIQQLYASRNHALGLSRERALQWTQGDEERINRLLENGIIEEKGEQIRLKNSIKQFLESEKGLPDHYRTATFLEELQDWDSLSLAFDIADNPVAKQQITIQLARQLKAWEEQLPRLIGQLTADKQAERLHQFSQGLAKLHVLLKKRRVFRTTSSLELEERVLDFWEKIPAWIDMAAQNYVSPLQAHIQALQDLRIRGLLSDRTNLHCVLEQENALFLQSKLVFQTQITPRQVMGSRKRRLPGMVFPRAVPHSEEDPYAIAEEEPGKVAGTKTDLDFESNVNLAELWFAFQGSGQDLVSFLKQSQENWEPILLEMISHYENELRFSGKWIKVGKVKYPELGANS